MSVFTTVMLTVGGIVVGVVVTILVARKYRSRKELSAYLVGFESTFEVTDWIKNQVEIRYNKAKVKSLERVRLILRNTGNRAIRKEDMVEPIRIIFPDPAKVIEIKKHKSSFEEYSIEQIGPNVLEVRFDLMNPREIVGLEILTTQGKPCFISIKGRGAGLKIKGVDMIPLRGRKEKELNWLMLMLGAVVLVSSSIAVFSYGWRVHHSIPLVGFRAFNVMTVIFSVFILLGLSSIFYLVVIKSRLTKQKRLESYLQDKTE